MDKAPGPVLQRPQAYSRRQTPSANDREAAEI